MNNQKIGTSQLYALLIGIDCYLPHRLPNGRYYRSLSGCVRDITLVEEFLQSKLGVSEECILKLKASNTGATQPPESRDEWPTYDNMVAAFQKLTEMAQSGDQVYIHYSGHGGRTPAKFPESKTNGLDESLVPMDIRDPKARYLRDIELAQILKKMVDKGLIVTIVLDSCHSGGATRGAGDAVARGIDAIDTTERPTQSLVASDDELIATWQSLTQETKRDLTLGSGWLPEPKGYVLLAACRPSESAYEYRVDGKHQNGALTYWLLEEFKHIEPHLTYKLIYDRIVPKIYSHLKLQIPLLEGDSTRVVFGNARVQSAYAVNVMQVDSENQQVLLNTGQAQAVRKGTQFVIYPPGVTDFTQLDQRLALVEITESDGATSSWATVKDTVRPVPIEQGAQAVLQEPGSMRLRSTVLLVYQDQDIVPPIIRQQAALEQVKQVLTTDGSGFIALATDDKPIDYQVAVSAQGEYEIWDTAGQVIQNLRPALRIDEDGVAVRLVQRLVHLTKYHNVQRLDNADSLSPLKGTLQVELLKAQPDFEPGDIAKPQPFDNPGSMPTIKVGEWIFVRVKNASSQVLNVTVLSLNSRWGIKQLYPRIEDMNFWPFDPGEWHLLPLRASLSDGYTEGTEIIKVFATVGATQFRWLELPVLDHPPQDEDIRGRKASNTLEQFLAAIVAPKLETEQRKLQFDSASWEWVTEQRQVRIQRPSRGSIIAYEPKVSTKE